MCKISMAVSTLLLCATSGAGAALASGLDPDRFDGERLRNTVALHAKLLCSGVFVSGRSAESVIAEDLNWQEYTFHDWQETEYFLGEDPASVRLVTQVPGAVALMEATAVFHPGHGCTLLPSGAERVAFVPRTWPTPEDIPANLPTAEPSDKGSLEKAVDFAFANDAHAVPQNTRVLAVVHKGKLLAGKATEGYSLTMPLPAWSMGKSLAGALLGVLAKEHGLSLDDAALFPDWRKKGDPRSSIEVRDLLQMSGGLAFLNPGFGDSLYYTDLHQHESVYFRGQDTRRLVLEAPLKYEPGTVFQYRNTNTLALMALIRAINIENGEDHLLWPKQALFDRIGAPGFVLEPDAFGNMVITGNVYASALDWSRVAQLFLDDGVVDGDRLWPRGWRDSLTEPAEAAGFYGGQVWLNRAGAMPDVPPDAYYFLGWLGQLVIIVPSQDLIVVRLGFTDNGGLMAFANELVSRIIATL